MNLEGPLLKMMNGVSMLNLFVLGILLIALGGFEKIMIFVSLADTVRHNYEAFKNLTPKSIWNIPDYTISAGWILIVARILLFLIKKSKAKFSDANAN